MDPRDKPGDDVRRGQAHVVKNTDVMHFLFNN
jgi:hypothetical protein